MSYHKRKFLKRIRLPGADNELLIFKTTDWGLSRKFTVRLSRDEIVWRLGPYRLVVNKWMPY